MINRYGTGNSCMSAEVLRSLDDARHLEHPCVKYANLAVRAKKKHLNLTFRTGGVLQKGTLSGAERWPYACPIGKSWKRLVQIARLARYSTQAFPAPRPTGIQVQDVTPAWRERVAALKNMPPVLRMVWEAAPSVIVASLTCRVLVALIPLAALYVTRSSSTISSSTGSTRPRCPTISGTWLVWNSPWPGLLAGVLIRLVAYFEIVLADRYSKHISTRIMEHASKLDLTTFEDPAVLRQDGARARAGHGSAGDDPVDGHADSAAGDDDQHGGRNHLFVAVDSGGADRLRDSGVHGRDAFRVHGLFAEFQADACEARDGLSAHRGRQQGKREGTEALRAGELSGRPVLEALERTARGERGISRSGG